jgi:hypothetical protein
METATCTPRQMEEHAYCIGIYRPPTLRRNTPSTTVISSSWTLLGSNGATARREHIVQSMRADVKRCRTEEPLGASVL